MQKITYTDKVTNNGQSLSGKFTSGDANEIKRVVNENAQEVIENYALKSDLIKVTAEYTPTTGTAIPTPIGNNAWTWLLGGRTYTQSSGSNITVAANTIAIASYNGTTWAVSGSIELPESATTLKQWSETSEDYPYQQNVAVRDADGVIYVSLVNGNTFPLEDETKWLSVGGGFKYENLEDLFKIIDANGNELASWDENGLLRTRHARNSIEAGAIEGLEENLKILNGSQQANSDLLQFLDATDGTIGYVDENGVWNLPKIKTSQIQVIPETNEVKVTNKRFFKIQNVDMLEVNIIRGKLPTDSSATRLPEKMVIELSTNGKKLITLNVEAVVQGQGTTAPTMRKLGYTFDLYNSEWKSVDIKINELVTTDSFHIKAFYTDVTHTRDVGCNMLFYEMAKSRPLDQWFVPPALRTDTNVETPDIFTEDARWGTWGIPCVLNWSGEFYGLYTWRLKKKRENYQVNRNNPNHIFIENQIFNVRLGARDYPDIESVATDYEFRSPRNITSQVETNVMDFFTYARGVYQGTIDLRSTYQDHLVLTAWLDSIIHGEVIGHKDSILNNVQYITYNGTHWQPLFTDGDACIGMAGTGLLIKEETGIKYANKDIFTTIRQVFLPELKQRYTELRNNGTLTFHKFREIFGGISQKIPQKIYQDDYIKWGSFSQDLPTMNQIYYYLLKRLEWLDTQWLLNQ